MNFLPFLVDYVRSAQILVFGALSSRRNRRQMTRALFGRSSREVPVPFERAWR